MNEAQSIESAGKRSWKMFVSNNEHSLEHIHESETQRRDQSPGKAESEAIQETLESILNCLANPSENKDTPLEKDLQSVRKIMDAISEARKEDTLTDAEALELVKFITSKFVERRVNRALSRLFPFRESKQWFYRSHKVLR